MVRKILHIIITLSLLVTIDVTTGTLVAMEKQSEKKLEKKEKKKEESKRHRHKKPKSKDLSSDECSSDENSDDENERQVKRKPKSKTKHNMHRRARQITISDDDEEQISGGEEDKEYKRARHHRHHHHQKSPIVVSSSDSDSGDEKKAHKKTPHTPLAPVACDICHEPFGGISTLANGCLICDDCLTHPPALLSEEQPENQLIPDEDLQGAISQIKCPRCQRYPMVTRTGTVIVKILDGAYCHLPCLLNAQEAHHEHPGTPSAPTPPAKKEVKEKEKKEKIMCCVCFRSPDDEEDEDGPPPARLIKVCQNHHMMCTQCLGRYRENRLTNPEYHVVPLIEGLPIGIRLSTQYHIPNNICPACRAPLRIARTS
jgi:hypothetical protein